MEACLDEISTKKCKKLREKGKCKDKKTWKKCMSTCKRCPGPCEDKISTKKCKKLKKKGKCKDKKTWKKCSSTCKRCPGTYHCD